MNKKVPILFVIIVVVTLMVFLQSNGGDNGQGITDIGNGSVLEQQQPVENVVPLLTSSDDDKEVPDALAKISTRELFREYLNGKVLVDWERCEEFSAEIIQDSDGLILFEPFTVTSDDILQLMQSSPNQEVEVTKRNFVDHKVVSQEETSYNVSDLLDAGKMAAVEVDHQIAFCLKVLIENELLLGFMEKQALISPSEESEVNAIRNGNEFSIEYRVGSHGMEETVAIPEKYEDNVDTWLSHHTRNITRNFREQIGINRLRGLRLLNQIDLPAGFPNGFFSRKELLSYLESSASISKVYPDAYRYALTFSP